ncbi:23S rRNA (uracil(1939)-C(5))-methyltransferase RlmD [candidate division KSB1 bacterium]
MNNNKKNTFEVDIEDIAVGGKGIGRIDGKIVFVEKAIPGQKVEVHIYKNKKDYAEGRVIKVLENSEYYKESECTHFSYCGGCSLQNLKYSEQLKFCRKWIEEVVSRITGIKHANIQDTIPSPDEFFYRNKMEFSFSSKVFDPEQKKIISDAVGLGFHLPGRYDTVINIDKCFLQSEQSNRILNFIRDFAEESGHKAYDLQKHTGFWRYLIVREGKLTNECLICIITSKCDEKENVLIEKLASELKKDIPEITSFFHAEHPGKSQAATWESIRNVFGKDFITEKIDNFVFRIDSSTFFQTNSRQVKNLYDIIKRSADLNGGETVYDLFGGVGTIGIYLSDKAAKIVGFELDPVSVEAAGINAEINRIKNCSFIQGKVRILIKYPPDLYKTHGKPDVVVVDPPRSGLDNKVCERIIALKPEKIIYVSCNPATLARDLKIFIESFEITEIIPVDMFPQTAHVETVTTLVKKK